MDDLINIAKLVYTKRLNFLMGAGASAPAIPTLGMLKNELDSNNSNENVNKIEDMNEELLKRVSSVSQELIATLDDDNNIQTEHHKMVRKNLEIYIDFIRAVVKILEKSNSRESPKSINIFTTNYDLFIERAIDDISFESHIVFNDGTRGYFRKILDDSNFNRMESYKGITDNYINEIPSITLIKPHGSVNWKMIDGDLIQVMPCVLKTNEMIVVPPDHHESEHTFLNNHFHDMLRVFQLELDKPQSILMVIGFSFGDDHIARMVRRALDNPELLVICFCHSSNDKNDYLHNLKFNKEPHNLLILTPEMFAKAKSVQTHGEDAGDSNKEKLEHFTLANLTEFLEGKVEIDGN